MPAKIESPTCRIDGCDRPRAACGNRKGHYSLCVAHRRRLDTHGDVRVYIPVRPRIESDLCRAEDCGRPRAGHGALCEIHQYRLRRYGDMMADTPSRRTRGSGAYDGKGYLRVFNPDHPLAPKNGIVPVHRIVLYDKVGPGEHPCHWCGKPVSWTLSGSKRLETDHLNAVRDDNRPENLVPSCKTCNTQRGKGAVLAAVS
jgi:hypothetical protein